jgi:hypothetical protein
MTAADAIRPVIERVQRRAFIAGLVGLLLTVVLGVRDWTQFFHSYLFAYVYWMVFAMGSLAILQLHHMTGGRWGLPIRRILEAGSRTIPAMTVLFIPVLLGMKMNKIYPWIDSSILGNEATDHFRRVYLEPRFFIVRAVVYFAIWNLLAGLLNKWSAEQDRTGDVRLKNRMSSLAAPGTVLWAITWSWAMVDWVMSLEPTWYSSIYGMVFMVVACLGALSFSVLMLRMLNGYEPLRESYEPSHLNDIGNLILTFTLLWTYMSFSQFLIIWSGNLKQEIPWYKTRAFTSWGYIAAALLIFHFFVPFFILLQRRVKRRLERLSGLALWMMAVTLVDVYWLIVPAFPNMKLGPRVSLVDIFAVIGIGGVWLGSYMLQLKKMPLLPLHDPRFEGVLEHSHGD